MLFDQNREWAHLQRMMNAPGWQEQAQRRAAQLERSGLWVGAVEAVRSALEVKRLANAAQKVGG